MHGPSGTYASDRLIRGSERCSTSAAPTISSPSNQPTDSASPAHETAKSPGASNGTDSKKSASASDAVR